MVDTSPGKIIIVDDSPFMLTTLCDMLGGQGYQTVGCKSAQEALVLLWNEEFDILLTDLTMPDMDGIALLRAALDIRPNIVGILMTGNGTIETAVEAMKVGALDYLLKPVQLSTALPVLSRAMIVSQLRAEKKALEKRLHDYAAELETANADLQLFVHSIAHDLRSPLAVIGGFAKVLLMNFSARIPPEAAGLIEKLGAMTRRMTMFIEELLRFSQFGRQPISKQPIDMSALVYEVLEELQYEPGSRKIETKVGELPPSVGDPALVKQVLMNLMANAFKFTSKKEQAVIEIGSERQNGKTVYFVRDNGVGFDAQKAKDLFNPFRQLHSLEGFEGTGIGLSIVQRIVNRHGGHIWAEAEVNKGATFYFTLSAKVS
jgi:signal transduction histidine kinase